MAARQRGGAGWVQRELQAAEPEGERCGFCGAWLVEPCDGVPADYCERALEALFGPVAWLGGAANEAAA